MYRKCNIERKVLVYVIITLSICSSIYSQSANLDSLNNIIEHIPEDHFEHWKSKVELSNYYVYHDLNRATSIIDSVLVAISDDDLKIKIPDDYYKHLVVKAWTSHGNQRLDEAIRYLEQADSIIAQLDDRSAEIEIQINLGALYVSNKDPNALSFVDDYLSKIDTTYGNRDEKIAWILGKKYKGEIYESKGYHELAFNQYKEVIDSGILNEIKSFQIGITKGICRIATFSGNQQYAIAALEELISDSNLYTYQDNSIKFSLVKNYVSIDSSEKTLKLSDEILSSDNLNNNLRFETYSVLTQIYITKGEFEKAESNLAKLSEILLATQDASYQCKLGLLKAQYYHAIEDNYQSNLSLDDISQTKLTQTEQLEFSKIRLLNTFDSKQLKAFNELDSINSNISNQKLRSRIQELVILHETEIEKDKNTALEQELSQAEKIAKQKNILLILFGLLGLLALISSIFILKNLKLSKKYNQLLSKDKAGLEIENQNLVFQNKELITMNDNLKKQKAKSYLIRGSEIHAEKFEFKSLDKIYLLYCDSISHIIAEEGGLRIHSYDKSYWTKMTIKEFITKDTSKDFLRIYRSTIVNTSHIKWVNHTSLMMNDGTELRVGRTYRNDIMEVLGD